MRAQPRYPKVNQAQPCSLAEFDSRTGGICHLITALRQSRAASEGDLVPPLASRRLSFPPVIDPEAPPIRPERHIPNSIATLRRRLVVALAKRLSRCPCCTRKIQRSKSILL